MVPDDYALGVHIPPVSDLMSLELAYATCPYWCASHGGLLFLMLLIPLHVSFVI